MVNAIPQRSFMMAVVGATAVVCQFGVCSQASATGETKKPNIIMFFTDDQGWTDTSVRMMADRADSRSDFFRTPTLERMAREGMVFSSAYAAAPTCTPSRAGMQFGKTPARLKQTVVHDRVRCKSVPRINPSVSNSWCRSG